MPADFKLKKHLMSAEAAWLGTSIGSQDAQNRFAQVQGSGYTLPQRGQLPLMTNRASSLAWPFAAFSPLRRLEARVGCWGSFGSRFTLFFGSGLQMALP